MPAMNLSTITVLPVNCVRGTIACPGDKSVSHRYAMLAALSEGQTIVENFSPGADCATTLECLTSLGVHITSDSAESSGQLSRLKIDGCGLGNLSQPAHPLDARNSGTTMRLLAGVLAGHSFECTLTGDESLQTRPMRRIIDPLVSMGAQVTSNNNCAPLMITGGRLRGITWTPNVPSAQIKSAILLAGLHASGKTTVCETVSTRDHTEQALQAFGVRVERGEGFVAVEPGGTLRGCQLQVPGDISSAAVWATAGAALAHSEIELTNVGLNPTRTGILDILRRAGAIVKSEIKNTLAGEPTGSIYVRYDKLRPVVITPAEVPSVIDELQILAALATHRGGGIKVTGAQELRFKESNRITALVAGLNTLGAEDRELPDGFEVESTKALVGGTVDAAGDHRLVMAFTLAALGASNPCTILGAQIVDVSYPHFFETLETVRS